jgi:pyruvate/2-oxoglutarate/acetoin dehydrogenase E1 component
LRIVEQTAKRLLQAGISIEVIDIQSLIPFDLNEEIRLSVVKTNRIL